jgi:hypothetical protein
MADYKKEAPIIPETELPLEEVSRVIHVRGQVNTTGYQKCLMLRLITA